MGWPRHPVSCILSPPLSALSQRRREHFQEGTAGQEHLALLTRLIGVCPVCLRSRSLERPSRTAQPCSCMPGVKGQDSPQSSGKLCLQTSGQEPQGIGAPLPPAQPREAPSVVEPLPTGPTLALSAACKPRLHPAGSSRAPGKEGQPSGFQQMHHHVVEAQLCPVGDRLLRPGRMLPSHATGTQRSSDPMAGPISSLRQSPSSFRGPLPRAGRRSWHAALGRVCLDSMQHGRHSALLTPSGRSLTVPQTLTLSL